MSNFGKNQLLKYGWTEGKGLGRNENGIAEALKPKLKFDTSGIGHKENDFQWWNSVYEKALDNVVLDKKNDQVSIKVANENAFNISSKQTGLIVSKEIDMLRYGKFLKTSTLQDGNLIEDKVCAIIEDSKIEDPTRIKISDEELFNACGGRTAHKGARHGLKLSGKLARIAEQEKQLLAAGLLKSSDENDKKKNVVHDKNKSNRKKKITEDKKCTSIDNNLEDFTNGDSDVLHPSVQRDEGYKLSKKSRKKMKNKLNNLAHEMSKKFSIKDGNEANSSEETAAELPIVNAKNKSKKKKCKRKHDEEQPDDETEGFQPVDNILQEPCTKKSKKTFALESNSESSDNDGNLNNLENTKYASERRSDRTFDNFTNVTVIDKLNAKIKKKKLKKLQRKERKKLDQLSENLIAVNLNIGTESENVEHELVKKIHKKKKKK